ncbi:MAG TPA: hypothetical protein VMP01_07135 [Pirellulaceae bacterium]|nr:hypothetical protein [Pirellulaceae bacterium]
MRFRLSDLIWLALYIALLAAVVAGLFEGRRRALAAYGTDEAQSQWDTWREDAKSQAKGKGPVARRVPKSAEPPALVLMRDYFAVCTVIAVALSSVLFGTLAFFIRGALSTSTTFVDRSPPEDRYE